MTRKRGTIFLYVFGAFFALAISGCSMISTAYALDAADAQCTAGLYSCDYPNHQDGQPCMRNKPCAEVKDSCVVSGVCDAPNHCNDTSACGKAPQLTKPLSSYMPPPAAIGANGQADYSQTAQPASVAPVSTKPADTFENSALPSPDNVGGPTPSVTAPAAQPSIPFSPDALSPNPTYTPPNGQGVNLTNDTIQQVSQLSPPNTDAPNSRGITPSPTPTDAPSTFGSGAPTPSVSANTEACSWGCALAKTESSVVSALKTAGNWVASVVSTISPDTSDAQNLNLTSPHSSSLETDPQLSVQNGTNAAADAFAKQQQLGDVINKDTLVLNTDVRTRDYINSSPWATPSGIIGPNTTFPLSLDANAYDTNNQTYQITGGFGQSKADLFSSNANLLGGTSATVDTSGMSSDWKNYYASFNSAYVFDGYQYDPKTGSLTATYWSPPATGADLEAMKYATDANTYNQNVNALNTFSSPSNVALVKYGAAITADPSRPPRPGSSDPPG